MLVGLGDGDEAARVKRGRIWSGGRCTRSNPLNLLLNPRDQSARVASLVADRINEAIRGGPGETPDDSTAVAENNIVIELHVPPGYRLNMPRFLASSASFRCKVPRINLEPRTATPVRTGSVWPKTSLTPREPSRRRCVWKRWDNRASRL